MLNQGRLCQEVAQSLRCCLAVSAVYDPGNFPSRSREKVKLEAMKNVTKRGPLRSVRASLFFLFLLGCLTDLGRSVSGAQCFEWRRLAEIAPALGDKHWSLDGLVYDSVRHMPLAVLGRPPLPDPQYCGNCEVCDRCFQEIHLFHWNGREWFEVNSPLPIPQGPRSEFGTCFNTARGTLMLFGGFIGFTYRNDFWEWNGSRWSEIKHPGAWPLASNFDSMIYDSGRDRVILLHALNDLPNGLYQTWEWTGTAWEQGPNLGPVGGQGRPAFCFDSGRGRGLLYAIDWDSIFEETWEYIPGATAAQSRWQQVAVSGAPFEGHIGVGLAYDSYRRQVIRQGGKAPSSLYSYLEATYAWDAAASKWTIIGAMPSSARRGGSALCFDPDLGQMVLYGGFRLDPPDNSFYFTDTWQLLRGEPGWVVDLPPRADWCQGENGVLAVTVAGDAEVQWYRNDQPIEGATGKILVVRSAAAPDAGTYVCVAKNECGEIASRRCLVNVLEPPSLTGPPVYDAAVCPGDSVSIQAPRYAGSLPIEIRLQKRTGATWSNTGLSYSVFAGREFFFIEKAAESDTGFYRFELTNSCGTVFSDEFYIRVGLEIVTQPANTAVDVCSGATLSVEALGVKPFQFQWRLDGATLTNGDSTIAGAQSSSLFIQPVLYAHEGNYDVIISDSCHPANVVTSKVAKLTVKPGPQWVQRRTNGPPARAEHALAYDSMRRVTTLFGGNVLDASSDTPSEANDLWEWDGNRWTERLPLDRQTGWLPDGRGGFKPQNTVRPVARRQHAMAYDARRGRLVLFGGVTYDPLRFQVFLNDTWEWDGLNWHYRTSDGPAPRSNPAMTYDSSRGVIVMTGGFVSGGAPDPTPGAVWEWNGNGWQSYIATNGPSINYSQVYGGLAYDTFHKLALFGSLGRPWRTFQPPNGLSGAGMAAAGLANSTLIRRNSGAPNLGILATTATAGGPCGSAAINRLMIRAFLMARAGRSSNPSCGRPPATVWQWPMMRLDTLQFCSAAPRATALATLAVKPGS